MTALAATAVFTLEDARALGLRKDRVYRMVASGEIERVGRGVYVQPGMIDPTTTSLAAATAMQPAATMCLTSALVYHDLSDAIPFGADIALPRGTRHPAGFEHVAWHSFDEATFEVGRTPMAAGPDLELAVYSAERTIVDCFRLMHLEGSDVAHTALRRWVAQRGNSPSSLLQVAASFPKALPRLRHALEVLL
ncbi:type IV toxin-antitoxin system AbiEi family antitoxin domain-containing protein [Specibacter cremeus]|uniref:type IV toxin-antitoxin system AbiEi family antitoxin domain-containing protein n=1 Tax=Specibacter cremeus TaxID=1629051 RepID=UPI001F0C0392|nr:type IV toxin-antitoxin system AbiEi family antitoxin domain-containing protein [Specibacter cremeus]